MNQQLARQISEASVSTDRSLEAGSATAVPQQCHKIRQHLVIRREHVLRLGNLGGARLVDLGGARLVDLGGARLMDLGGARLVDLGGARLVNLGGARGQLLLVNLLLVDFGRVVDLLVRGRAEVRARGVHLAERLDEQEKRPSEEYDEGKHAWQQFRPLFYGAGPQHSNKLQNKRQTKCPNLNASSIDRQL